MSRTSQQGKAIWFQACSSRFVLAVFVFGSPFEYSIDCSCVPVPKIDAGTTLYSRFTRIVSKGTTSSPSRDESDDDLPPRTSLLFPWLWHELASYRNALALLCSESLLFFLSWFARARYDMAEAIMIADKIQSVAVIGALERATVIFAATRSLSLAYPPLTLPLPTYTAKSHLLSSCE